MVDDFSYYRSWIPESLSASIRFVGAQSPDVAAVGLVEKELFPFVYAQGDHYEEKRLSVFYRIIWMQIALAL